MDDLFGSNIAVIPATPKPASVQVALLEALPLAHFLIAFARYQRGKYRPKQQEMIVHAIQERLKHWDISAADVLWWITEGLPKAGQVYEPIEVLSAGLDTRDVAIARRAAILITGVSEGPVAQACQSTIERLLGGIQSGDGASEAPN